MKKEKDYESFMALRLSTDQHARLRRVAEAEEVSVSEFVRKIIADRLGD